MVVLNMDELNLEVAGNSFETFPEPDVLCESGDSITLRAIVWHESEGMLVVSVKWRGLKYYGCLLDGTKDGWAPYVSRLHRIPKDNLKLQPRNGRGRGRGRGRPRSTTNSTQNSSLSPPTSFDSINSPDGGSTVNHRTRSSTGGNRGGKGATYSPREYSPVLFVPPPELGSKRKITKDKEDRSKLSPLTLFEPTPSKKFKENNDSEYNQMLIQNNTEETLNKSLEDKHMAAEKIKESLNEESKGSSETKPSCYPPSTDIFFKPLPPNKLKENNDVEYNQLNLQNNDNDEIIVKESESVKSTKYLENMPSECLLPTFELDTLPDYFKKNNDIQYHQLHAKNNVNDDIIKKGVNAKSKENDENKTSGCLSPTSVVYEPITPPKISKENPKKIHIHVNEIIKKGVDVKLNKSVENKPIDSLLTTYVLYEPITPPNKFKENNDMDNTKLSIQKNEKIKKNINVEHNESAENKSISCLPSLSAPPNKFRENNDIENHQLYGQNSEEIKSGFNLESNKSSKNKPGGCLPSLSPSFEPITTPNSVTENNNIENHQLHDQNNEKKKEGIHEEFNKSSKNKNSNCLPSLSPSFEPISSSNKVTEDTHIEKLHAQNNEKIKKGSNVESNKSSKNKSNSCLPSLSPSFEPIELPNKIKKNNEIEKDQLHVQNNEKIKKKINEESYKRAENNSSGCLPSLAELFEPISPSNKFKDNNDYKLNKESIGQNNNKSSENRPKGCLSSTTLFFEQVTCSNEFKESNKVQNHQLHEIIAKESINGRTNNNSKSKSSGRPRPLPALLPKNNTECYIKNDYNDNINKESLAVNSNNSENNSSKCSSPFASLLKSTPSNIEMHQLQIQNNGINEMKKESMNINDNNNAENYHPPPSPAFSVPPKKFKCNKQVESHQVLDQTNDKEKINKENMCVKSNNILERNSPQFPVLLQPTSTNILRPNNQINYQQSHIHDNKSNQQKIGIEPHLYSRQFQQQLRPYIFRNPLTPDQNNTNHIGKKKMAQAKTVGEEKNATPHRFLACPRFGLIPLDPNRTLNVKSSKTPRSAVDELQEIARNCQKVQEEAQNKIQSAKKSVAKSSSTPNRSGRGRGRPAVQPAYALTTPGASQIMHSPMPSTSRQTPGNQNNAWGSHAPQTSANRNNTAWGSPAPQMNPQSPHGPNMAFGYTWVYPPWGYSPQ